MVRATGCGSARGPRWWSGRRRSSGGTAHRRSGAARFPEQVNHRGRLVWDRRCERAQWQFSMPTRTAFGSGARSTTGAGL